ncbi:hypothetical protein B0A48_02536 [Cryoendolithus antarcticus]|uniref:Carrier domain-containing protein n=1 Tax=Cryoendolithus antarcticus TaxID=1507870 RepID=A0A1V8TPD7_9PEZI|nr:hypothetical protein B0A48_02536 [Cryoendolithus antarcticus]
MAQPNYFTCTLGQAAALGLQQPHKTVNAFVDAQADALPDAAAVAFPAPSGTDSKGDWTYTSFTFSQVRSRTVEVARSLLKDHRDVLSERASIGMLCPSTPDLLFTWLALMKLGHAVLLIAPQCQPAAIKALCEQCEVPLLLFHEQYADLAAATDASDKARPLAVKQLFVYTVDGVPSRAIEDTLPVHVVSEHDLAYLHHTSGTSSGMPKPIPQPHHAAVGVLPSFSNGRDAASFTTTPLYHGGIADLFRAWSSGAQIWLFPGKGVPITAKNIVKCLDVAAAACAKDASIAKVRYFSSVPYVLQMLEADDAGLRFLQNMDITGVGGAALPTEIGDRLVHGGVNLISRFGSAECGFLLNSHRIYEDDSEWQYLRGSSDDQYIRFEPRDEGLSELVVLKDWPHMAKRNRDDGSYATSDLFEPHSTIKGAWKYHSRADSQLTLITGKKFDPAPLEAAIATSDLVEDALIFGTGQPYPGVLVFRSEKADELRDADFMARVWPSIEKLNSGSQDHARISKSSVVAMAKLTTPLEKSSKGTIIRGATEKRFAAEIAAAYTDSDANDETAVKDEDLVDTVKEIVNNVASHKSGLTEETDLHSYGIDSVAGMQIRSRLRRLLPADQRNLPITVVEDYSTVNGLADYVLKRRHGQDANTAGVGNDHEYMKQLVEEYSQFMMSETKSPACEEERTNGTTHGGVVILTGATGALGAHILSQYRADSSISRIYCLVRGADVHAARERVAKALSYRRLLSLYDDPNDKVVVLPARLSDAELGLDQETYAKLAREATIIMHVAWSVNFRMKLRSFVRDSIAGLSHLINLALAAPASRTAPRIAFCSSVASVMASPSSPIPEILIDDPAVATDLGYSKSKWVAEQICARANGFDRLRGRVAIFRVGQVAGDTKTGVWNAKEAWPLMLGSVRETGTLPALEDEVLDWLPVDICATALIQGAGRQHEDEVDGLEIYHVVNSHTTPTWSDLLGWLKAKREFEIIGPADWVKELEALAEEGSQSPALQLLELWRNAYGDKKPKGVDKTSGDEIKERKIFAVDKSVKCLPVLQSVKPVDEAYFALLWKWIIRLDPGNANSTFFNQMPQPLIGFNETSTEIPMSIDLDLVLENA